MTLPGTHRFGLLPGPQFDQVGAIGHPLVSVLLRSLERHPNRAAVSQAMRASSLSVRLGRLLRLSSEQLDALHLCALGRLDLPSNRGAWDSSGLLEAEKLGELAGEREVSDLVAWCLTVCETIDREGIFYGYEQLTNAPVAEPFVAALWDLRFEEAYWLRLMRAPSLEALLAAGPLGLAPVEPAAVPHLPFDELEPGGQVRLSA